MLTVHMIGNAHLDPVWLWRWQQGADERLPPFVPLLTAVMSTRSFSIHGERHGSIAWSNAWIRSFLRGFVV
jgi:hypothetical protein